jgi:predicted enzyme related to lactoylglutathione lyase
MIKNIENVLLYSPNGEELADFYRDKVGINFKLIGEMGEDMTKVFGANWKNGSEMSIMTHSKLKGKNLQPERYMLNFEVNDIDQDVKKLKKSGVKLIQDIYHVENYGLIATFEDIDGNYFQLVQVKA